ncbi:MAG TPA: hypothetical protein VMH28_22915 [Candidatus Acidoferrales bacterium]|nr:hypothetical protein [Candidatus Acidoferrales bacterium]
MQKFAKCRVFLAIAGIAFLLLNPAGVCAGTPSTQSPAHPCCPPPAGSTHHHGSGGRGCVCIDRQAAAPVLPSLDDTGRLMPGTVTNAYQYLCEIQREVVYPPGGIAFPEDRVLAFHQLLV